MNSNQFERPYLKVLSTKQIQQIHDGACEILENVGVMIRSEQAKLLLKEAGATVTKGDIVRIPQHLVESALKKAPGKVSIYSSDGERELSLGADNTFFCANVDCPDFRDYKTEERRSFKYEDAAKAATIVESLPFLDSVLTTGLLSDKNSEVSDILSVRQMMANTVKPIVATANSTESFEKMIDMASAVVGNRETLKEKPSLLLLSEPISPLKHEGVTTDIVLLASQQDIPIVCYPMPMAGSTAPASIAGTLVQAHAEEMSALTMIQLMNPGSAMIYGAVASTMDMKSAIFSYGAPELNLMSAALADLGHYFDLPIWGTAGTTDTKGLDQQAASEISMQVLISILSGGDLVHDVGLMDQSSVIDLKSYVLTNEIIGMAKKISEGVRVNKQEMALDVISEVGPGGHFLKEKHTLDNFRNFWMPNIFDRSSVGEDIKSLEQRLIESTQDLLNSNRQPVLPGDKLREVDNIVQTYSLKVS